MPIRRLLRTLVPRRFRPRPLAMRFALERSGLVVQAGPFAGMRYPPPRPRDWYYPQILGSYERELDGAFARLTAGDVVERFVVAGAAEGYYAVGLARRHPAARVVAYEADPGRRAQFEKLAAANAVSPELRGLCDLSELARQLERPERTLLLVDIEGGEALLLDPERIPALAAAPIVVEVHDFLLPGVGELLARRFAATHRVERIAARRRVAADLPPLALPWRRLLGESYRSLLEEGRPAGCYWLVLEPLRGAA